jgi:histidinol phosphatase-like PHP family hydrolase
VLFITTIDFHIHGKLTSSYCFEKSQFLKTIKEAQKEGINCLELTEHLHSQKFLEGYNFLNDNYLLSVFIMSWFI